MSEQPHPEFPLDDDRRENPKVAEFHGYHERHTEVFERLVAAVREVVELVGSCDIHTARGIVKARHGVAPGRNYLPAYARMIAKRFPELAKTLGIKPSRFDQ